MKLLMTVATAALMAGAGVPAHAHEGKKKGGVKASAPSEQKDWGIAGDPKTVTRTIEIVMTDAMRFTPDRIEIRQGEILEEEVQEFLTREHEDEIVLALATVAGLEPHVTIKRPKAKRKRRDEELAAA